MARHVALEKAEGISYTQWQAEQLAALAEYRTANRQQFNGYFSRINGVIELALRRAYELGGTHQEAAILQALKNGWSGRRDSGSDKLGAEFFRINERRLNSYIKSVMADMRRAETALMRMADDQYRKAIFNAGVAYNSGTYTLPQAIDAATKEYLSRGINCIEYKNGARVLIDTYAEMALRTSATRCYLMGESAKRDEWGVNTVIVNRRGSACPKCLQYVGKVFYDDVYGNLPVPDIRYPRLSSAIAGGLYHPNCKDIHTTYFEDISEPPKSLTADEEHRAAEVYALEQQQCYNERQIRRYRRLAEYTLDTEQKAKYTEKLRQWEKVNAKFVAEHGDVLKRRYEREAIRDLTVRVERPPSVHGLSENSNSPEKSLDKSAESGIIELGSKFLSKSDPLYYNADKIKPIKGYDDIVFHGDPYHLIAYGNSGEEWLYNAKEAAEMIKHCQSFHEKPIRLIACQIGAEQDGIAQQIADELGVVVLAPTETVFVDIDGDMFISNNRELAELWNMSSSEERKHIHQTGTWIPFEPKKR